MDNCPPAGGLDSYIHDLVAVQREKDDVSVLQIDSDLMINLVDRLDVSDRDSLAAQGENLLDRFDADIFHLHDWYGGVLVPTLLAMGRRSFITTSHLPLRRGFTYRDIELGWRKKALVEHAAFQHSRKITVPSKFLRQLLINEYGIDQNRILTIEHGVNSSKFTAPENSDHDPSERTDLLFVGRLMDQKGPEILIRAFPTILKSHPSTTLQIIGSGSRKTAIKKLIDRLGIRQSIKLVPE